MGLLSLLVALVVLAIIAWVAKAVLVGLNAPAWLLQIVVGVVLIVAVLMVASAFGVPTPNLR